MLPGLFDNDNSLLRFFAEQEFTSPTHRKQASSSQTIYLLRLSPPKPVSMLLSDSGEARTGLRPHGGDIMAIQYPLWGYWVM